MKRLVLLTLICIGLSTCQPKVDFIEQIDFVDGSIFLNVCRYGLNWFGDRKQRCALTVSSDRGKSWKISRCDGLKKFVFADRRRGFLLIENDLHRTEDGGATKSFLRTFDETPKSLQITDAGG